MANAQCGDTVESQRGWRGWPCESRWRSTLVTLMTEPVWGRQGQEPPKLRCCPVWQPRLRCRDQGAEQYPRCHPVGAKHRAPGCQGPFLHRKGLPSSPQLERSHVPQSPHRRGCTGGPRPAPHGAACYSAQVRRRLMKPVPGELPHSSGERLINEASATAAGASARGTGTGTGSGREGGQTDRRTDGSVAGRTGSWYLSWLGC